MSETAPSGNPQAPSQPSFAPPWSGTTPVTWPPPPSAASRKPARWPTLAALGVALLAVGVGALGWFYPRPPRNSEPATSSAPAFTQKQISDAKTRACGAFETVKKGIALQTHTDGGADPAMTEAAAANARLSLVSGGWYLRDHLDPATPPPLAAAIRSFTAVVLDLAANYLAGAKDADPPQAALLSAGESAAARVAQLCT